MLSQEVIDLQDKAVKELLNKAANQDETTFKAPTGSGKTFMTAKFMDGVLQEKSDVIFLVSCLSKAKLAQQNNVGRK